jgi:glycosyltransferase involved in cell wall biosynthesis
MNILVLPRYGKLGASSRLRLYQYLEWFENAGISYKVSPLIADGLLRKYYETGKYSKIELCCAYLLRIYNLLISSKYSLILIEKEALPWLPAWFEKMLLGRVPYVLDFDDAIFHNYDLHRSVLIRRLFSKRIDKLIANSRLVLAGNVYLATRAASAGAEQIEIIPTVIDLARYKIKPITLGQQDNITLRVVWIGSPSTLSYLKILEKPLAQLAGTIPFNLRIIGGGSITMQGVNIEILPWSESTESKAITECDVGVMPLLNTPWEQGKCAYKLIQFMACGLPTVASPVGANSSVIVDGLTGFLADTDDAWVDKLKLLLSDAALRKKMGNAGRERVEAYYCLQQTAPILSGLLLKLGEV